MHTDLTNINSLYRTKQYSLLVMETISARTKKPDTEFLKKRRKWYNSGKKIRKLIQYGFFITTVLIGIQFTIWYKYYESGGKLIKVSRPAGVEAERERRAKVIHAEGEFQAAEKINQAAKVLGETQVGIQLRYLQTLVEISSEKNSTTLFPIPIDLVKPFLEKFTKSET